MRSIPLHGAVRSKLPHTKGSIFSALSRVAKQYDAINLAQGFPDFAPDPRLLNSLATATQGDHNQYGMPEGSEALRRSIGRMYEDLYSLRLCPDIEISITAGATQAISAAVSSFVHPGEEVIFLAPAFESYEPSILLAGAHPVCVALRPPHFEIDWEEVEKHVSVRTRMIIVNSPHNPSGRCWSSDDVARLAALVERHNLLVLSDEVYHNMVFDGPHLTALSEPRLRERTIVVGSLGKTMHVTGWRIGYAAAAAPLTAELRKVLQFTTYAATTPLQQAMAEVLGASTYLGLPALFRAKRDRFLEGLRGSRFRFMPTSGGYFQLLDYSAISTEPDTQFARLLISEHGVAGLPVSGFGAQYANSRLLRFCFAKSDETIDKAAIILRDL